MHTNLKGSSIWKSLNITNAEWFGETRYGLDFISRHLPELASLSIVNSGIRRLPSTFSRLRHMKYMVLDDDRTGALNEHGISARVLLGIPSERSLRKIQSGSAV